MSKDAVKNSTSKSKIVKDVEKNLPEKIAEEKIDEPSNFEEVQPSTSTKNIINFAEQEFQQEFKGSLEDFQKSSDGRVVEYFGQLKWRVKDYSDPNPDATIELPLFKLKREHLGNILKFFSNPDNKRVMYNGISKYEYVFQIKMILKYRSDRYSKVQKEKAEKFKNTNVVD